MNTAITRRHAITAAACGLAAAAFAGSALSVALAEEGADYGVTGAVALSAPDFNFDGEYACGDFNDHSQADADRQGIDTYADSDVVYQIINYDELNRLLSSEGNYLIEFGGGSWCHNTRAFSPSANDLAKEYGIKTIYTYDFDFDNNPNGWTFIRMTNGTEYGVGVNWNFMYGQVVSDYLFNLDDWVELGLATDYAITYTNADGDEVTVPRLQEPFFLLYNKDNTVDNSGKGHDGDPCPVVWAFEEMVDRDAEGVYITSGDEENPEREYITEEYNDRLRQLFDYVADNDLELAEFDEAAYLADVFGLEDASALDVINYAQLTWLLGQQGSAVIAFADAADDASKAVVAAAAQAAAGKAKVYVFDPILDNGLTEQWGYDRTPNIMTDEDLTYMVDDLVSAFLTNVDGIEPGSVIAYNADALDEDGFAAPVFASADNADDVAGVIDAYLSTL